MRVTRVVGAAVAVLVFAGCGVLADARASEAPSLDLPFLTRIEGSACGPVVDEARDHLFVAYPGDNRIDAFAYDGTLLATFTADQPCAMVVVASTVYVVEGGEGAVRQIDSASLTDEGVLVGGLFQPGRIAIAGGKLWTSIYSIENGGRRLVSIGFDGTVATFRFPATAGLPFPPLAPMFATSPARPSELYIADGGSSANEIQRLDVSGAEPVLLERGRVADAVGFRDITLSPDGSRLVVAVPSPYFFAELDASSLVDTGTRYFSSGLGYPSAVAVSPAFGGLVATAREGGANLGPDITIEQIGRPGPLAELTTRWGRVGNLVMTSDARFLFATDPFGITIYGRPSVPVILPGSSAVAEGDSGTTSLSVPVTLSKMSTATVSVDWVTFVNAGPPECQADPATDYTPTGGTVTFAPGDVAELVTVSVNGDTLVERDECVIVSFRNPTNAAVGGFYGLGVGTVTNDDLPVLVRPGSGSVVEGDSGTVGLDVPVTLSKVSTATVSVDWVTFVNAGPPECQADPATDYTPTGGTVTFAPGDVAELVTVSVNGDTLVERDECVIVSFRNPTNAALGGFYGLGVGTVTNDD